MITRRTALKLASVSLLSKEVTLDCKLDRSKLIDRIEVVNERGKVKVWLIDMKGEVDTELIAHEGETVTISMRYPELKDSG